MDPSSPTPSQISAFRESGFVRIPGLLAIDEVEVYAEAVERAVANRTRHDLRRFDQKTPYEQSLQQCLNLWEDEPSVRPLSFHPRIGQSAAALLGCEAVRIWHDQSLYKEAGGRATSPHQDQPYWSIAEPLTITAWIPFQDVRQKNGALAFLPGSHNSGLREFANIFSGEGLDLEAFPETRQGVFEKVESQRGDVVFHHGLTIHRAYPNETEVSRRAHTVIYFADGCTRTAFKHPSVERPGIAVGSKIASDLTPIAWPRPAGDLPEPPDRPEPPIPGWPGWTGRKPRRTAP
ncbi:MAG: phytanoyl-CoA dioxygenase family protein [Myxococcota bacterium]|jgi:ectoine hydroxylase-related dioxygenase (phytanoyl-CoA dioxygenase family)|nr:phytanoyl-CoA dioxygenase family protein [Myxococcota bacterium]